MKCGAVGAVVLGSILSAGCFSQTGDSETTTGDCIIEYAVDESLAKPVRAASVEWNKYTICKLVEARRDGAKAQWWVLSAEPGDGMTGFANTTHSLVLVTPNATDDQALRIALHEFGHVLGIPHQSSGVMCGVDVDPTCPYEGPSALSEEDVEACKAAGACH